MSRELSNVEVVVLAVYRLGGERASQDTEDIAVEADRVAPGRFRWRKYPEFISDELIRVYLSDAKKHRNGALLAGDGSRGWRLTLAGATVAAKLDGTRTNARQRTPAEVLKRRRLEKNRLLDLPAWSKHADGGSVSVREAEAVFRIGDYTRPERRAEMMDRLQLLFVQDPQTAAFLEQMAAIARTRGTEK
jgi:hypothetical protein